MCSFWHPILINHISIMLYILSQCFDSSNANTIAHDIKHRMWIYCKLILIRVVCLWISWNEIIYIYRLVGLTFAGWYAHEICWLQWPCLHNSTRCLWVEILGVWDAPLLCWTDIAVWDWLRGAISKTKGAIHASLKFDFDRLILLWSDEIHMVFDPG